jgi:LmbE family N-acetylglucosaminyl deacetylase
VLVLTDGAASHPNSRAVPPSRLRAMRAAEARAAVAALGLPPDRIGFLNLPDSESPVAGPAFDAAVTAVASLAMRSGARTVLATWAHDPHCDHESAHLIAAAAAAEAGLRHLAYPVWGLTLPPDVVLPGPLPTGRRIDVAPFLERKRRAIAAHRSQHGAIVDDPAGFTLPPAFLALFDRPVETLLDVP